MPAKRVSVKGRGADLFFGEERPTGASVPSAPPAATDDPGASVHASTHARTPARKRARVQSDEDGDDDRTAEIAPAVGPLASEILDAIGQQLAARATVSNAFRYTDEELTRQTDVLYALGKRTGTKLAKQDVARLGLDAVLWDYQVRGEASLLAAFARRKARAQGG